MARIYVTKVLDFLQAFRQMADDILYLPLSSFGVEADGLRVLHFHRGRGYGGMKTIKL